MVALPGLAQISSFDQSTECWSYTGDGSGPFFQSSGGNSGGWVEVKDLNIRETWFWVAPGQFLYDKSRSIGKFMLFDIKTNFPGASRLLRNVIIEGGGISMGATMPNTPGSNWTHNDIQMVPANWHYISDDATISASDFAWAMAHITRIRILGEYSREADVGGLDNFILEPQGNMNGTPADICLKNCFLFSPQSVANPTQWTWNFSGGNPASSTQANPGKVCFPGPGTYLVSLVAARGNCFAETLTTQITVGPDRVIEQFKAICLGDSLMLPNGKWFRKSGTFPDSVTTNQGCDSVIITHVLVKVPQVVQVKNVLCFGQTFSVGDTIFSGTGHYIRQIQTKEGCDSTVELDLTILPEKSGYTS